MTATKTQPLKQLDNIFACCAQLFSRGHQIIRKYGIPVPPIRPSQSRNIEGFNRFLNVFNQFV
jgi:hypothetical protein